MLTMSYCSFCHTNVASHGVMICEMFEKICSHVAFTGSYYKYKSPEEIEGDKIPFSAEPHFHVLVKFLETKGYVVTTEYDENTIQVKPEFLFYEDSEEGSRMFHFCRCGAFE